LGQSQHHGGLGFGCDYFSETVYVEAAISRATCELKTISNYYDLIVTFEPIENEWAAHCGILSSCYHWLVP
jgi:hypothetical protein